MKRANYKTINKCNSLALTLYERGYSAIDLIKIIEDPAYGWDGGGKSGDEIGSYVYRVEVQGYGKNGFITDFVSMGTITLIR